jgi:hypothetical protein
MHPLLTALALAADPATGAASDVIQARPFTVSEPYAWTMRGDRPTVDAGWIVALRVAPLRPTQQKQPILFSGDMPARPVSIDVADGCLVVVVAGATPLDQRPLFWTEPDLPERFDSARAVAARDAATAAGWQPIDPRRWSDAVARGGPLLAAADEAEVMRVAEEHAAAACGTP